MVPNLRLNETKPSTHCADVTTQFAEIIEPPQITSEPVAFVDRINTFQGNWFAGALLPFIIRNCGATCN